MGEKKMNFTAFGGNLSPNAKVCLKLLIGNARGKIVKEGPQSLYELSLAQVLKESGSTQIDSVAKSINEIIQCKVEVKEGDFQYFFPFLSSIRIEAGVIKYTIPREVEEQLPAIPEI